MKYNVTEIKFDFDEGDIDDPITFEEQVQIIHDNLGVWEADDEDEENLKDSIAEKLPFIYND